MVPRPPLFQRRVPPARCASTSQRITSGIDRLHAAIDAGRHTILDQYTFRWRDGRLALALGLGSLFNHADTPNVAFTLDTRTDSIRYTVMRHVEDGDELTIFYGNTLWFGPPREVAPPSDDDEWGGLKAVAVDEEKEEEDLDEIIPEAELPFTRLTISADEEDESTMRVWALDVPHPAHIGPLLRYVKARGLDTPALAHLKRVRKRDGVTTLLLCAAEEIASGPTSDSGPTAEPPALADILSFIGAPLDTFAPPYILPVPLTPARTPATLATKSVLWPVTYAPRRTPAPGEEEGEQWTRGRVRWAEAAMKKAILAGQEAELRGEVPVGVCVPTPYGEGNEGDEDWITAHDTRTSAGHPLRHAVLNVVRAIADRHAAAPAPAAVHVAPAGPLAAVVDPGAQQDRDASSLPTPSPSPAPHSSSAATHDAPAPSRGYLLTAHSLFATHEPCIMCAMALLHSRVRNVFYLHPRPKTGGLGGGAAEAAVCVPGLKGVNHRFGVAVWKAASESEQAERLDVGDDVDV
ncbi:hypothetical protein HWV62_3759 [Athelia sp. TMB]|nr:hypothetical protein HWV62_3759 [Athelia sp. TMB]